MIIFLQLFAPAHNRVWPQNHVRSVLWRNMYYEKNVKTVSRVASEVRNGRSEISSRVHEKYAMVRNFFTQGCVNESVIIMFDINGQRRALPFMQLTGLLIVDIKYVILAKMDNSCNEVMLQIILHM